MLTLDTSQALEVCCLPKDRQRARAVHFTTHPDVWTLAQQYCIHAHKISDQRHEHHVDGTCSLDELFPHPIFKHCIATLIPTVPRTTGDQM